MKIPTSEPTHLRAGDTWRWRREDLADFPATSYALTYRLKSELGGIEFVADPDAGLFSITVDASVTQAVPSGIYAWQAQVDGPLGRFTVGQGEMTVLPTLFTGAGGAALDLRSHARRALDAINAQLERRATADQKEYELNVGGSMRRVVHADLKDLLAAKQYYEGLVASEEAAARAEAGKPDKRRSYVRFSGIL